MQPAQMARFNGRAQPVPAPLAVTGAPQMATQLAKSVADLKFQDMFVLPVGPKGLQPSARLLALNGKTVRIVGYMANAEVPTAGRLILTPLPVSLGDEDESLSDDLPASAVFVHLSGAGAQALVPNYAGLMQLTGTLHIGAVEEPDGRTSYIQLQVDAGSSQLLAGTSKQ